MTGYAFHPEALLDLEEIWDYIAADSVDAADRLIAEVQEALEKVSPLPYQGHRRSDLTSRPLRFIVVRDFLIAYAPDEHPVWVVAILHGRRNPRVLAATLRDRE